MFRFVIIIISSSNSISSNNSGSSSSMSSCCCCCSSNYVKTTNGNRPSVYGFLRRTNVFRGFQTRYWRTTFSCSGHALIGVAEPGAIFKGTPKSRSESFNNTEYTMYDFENVEIIIDGEQIVLTDAKS